MLSIILVVDREMKRWFVSNVLYMLLIFLDGIDSA